MFFGLVAHDDGLDAFRAEVRDFCRTRMAAEVRSKQEQVLHLERAEYDAWLKLLGKDPDRPIRAFRGDPVPSTSRRDWHDRRAESRPSLKAPVGLRGAVR